VLRHEWYISPSVQLKNSAGTPQGERIAAALRDLFDIE
jgi:hypothetical protein